MKEIIIASANQNKIKEVKEILAPLGYNLKSIKEVGIDIDIEEDGETFEENALIKARALSGLTGKTAIADDSGLEVEVLDNAPGIYSARYSGKQASDKDNNLKLLKELKDVPWSKRGGRFVSAIAIVYPDGEEITMTGECSGIIALKPLGKGGFGYDPVFYLPQLDKTYAQLTPEEKNKISHRSKALDKLKVFLLAKLKEDAN